MLAANRPLSNDERYKIWRLKKDDLDEWRYRKGARDEFVATLLDVAIKAALILWFAHAIREFIQRVCAC